MWKELQGLYGKDFAAAFETETWVEARFYTDLGFSLPGSFQDIQDQLQRHQDKMPRLAEDDPFSCSLETFVGRAQGVTVRFRTSLEEKARQAQRGRGPSRYGAFAMPDVENELYEMQQNLFASVMGGFGLNGLGNALGGESDSDGEGEEEEEEEQEEDEEEQMELEDLGEEEPDRRFRT